MASCSGNRSCSFVERLRFYFNEAGIRSSKAIAKRFKTVETSDTAERTLTFRELQDGLEDFGLDFTHQELRQFFESFPQKADDTISLEEVISAVRPTLNPSRRNIVERAFDKIDYDHDGLISIEDLSESYDVTKHPKFKSGEWNKAKTLKEFLDTFVKKAHNLDEEGKKEQGGYTRQNFIDYYAMISPSIDRDVNFDFVVRNAWKI